MKQIALEPNQVPAELRGSYRGKRFYAEIRETVTIPADSGNWSGGSRDVWFARSFDGSVKLSNTMSAPWDQSRADQTIALDSSMVVVRHHQGSFEYLTIYVHPDAVAKLIPNQTTSELTANEKTVLKATRSLKSSYNGMNRYQMSQRDYGYARMSELEWELAKGSLIAKGLLNKAGAITVAGRNASH